MSEKWYTLRCKDAAPSYAIFHLRQQRFEAFFPIIRERKVVRRRRIVAEVPIFPSYAFVSFDIENNWRWRKINSTYGVVRLLPMRSEMPLPLPTGFVEGLQASAVLTDVADLVRVFAKDQLVKIIFGAFVDHIGRVVSSTAKATRVKLVMFGRETVAAIPTADLVPASKT